MQNNKETITTFNGSNFSVSLYFLKNNLVRYYIKYDEEEENFVIDGNSSIIKIERQYCINKVRKCQMKEIIKFESSEEKDLLTEFNENVMSKYNNKIMKKQISEEESKELLFGLLDYLIFLSKREITNLVEKIKESIKNDEIKVVFHEYEVIMRKIGNNEWSVVALKNKNLL